MHACWRIRHVESTLEDSFDMPSHVNVVEENFVIRLVRSCPCMPTYLLLKTNKFWSFKNIDKEFKLIYKLISRKMWRRGFFRWRGNDANKRWTLGRKCKKHKKLLLRRALPSNQMDSGLCIESVKYMDRALPSNQMG